MNAHWAPVALEAALRFATGLPPGDPPTELALALGAGSAAPDGATWVELTATNYARQPATLAYADTEGSHLAVTTADVSFVDLGACAYRGVRLYDAGSGSVWFWADLSVEVDVEEGETVTFEAGLIKVGLAG